MWLGALAGALVPVAAGFIGALVGVVLTAVVRHRAMVLVGIVGVGMLAGAVAAERRAFTLDASLPAGRGEVIGVAVTDGVPYGGSTRFVLRPEAWVPSSSGIAQEWAGPGIVIVADQAAVAAGDQVGAVGRIRSQATLVRGDPVAGRMVATEIRLIEQATSPFLVAGNAFRRLVQGRTSAIGETAEAALLRGFLIGDTTDLSAIDLESLRRAGLTHFVAVSGSNVALVLGAWWLVLGPIGAGNRIRAATGLVVLGIFVVATRWESSVIRAATMAALVLGGRAIGVALDAWMALGGAVVILLLASGDLAYDVGFQLSVAATAGVLAGSRIWLGRSPGVVWGLLGATLSAQIVVAPLLLLHFGTIPLLSPLANLLAAPLVTIATGLAGVGVIVGWEPLLHVAGFASGLVLDVARVAAEWPQLGITATLGLAVLVGLAWLTHKRWLVATVLAVVLVASVVSPGPPSVPSVVVLDVGQGDAILLRDPSGAVVLMDGGRDPTTLRQSLRRHGVRHLDLVIASHGDADHVGGFEDLLDFASVGRVWVPAYAATGDLLDGFVTEATQQGIPVDSVHAGMTAQIGEFALEVLGPLRRYATDNDGSVVLLATANMRTVLLPGDIGAVAQAEIEAPPLYVIVVPHHGAATSDLAWLASSVGEVAVISVGPNTYGHPVPEVVSVLRQSGAEVLTTVVEGDITIPLS